MKCVTCNKNFADGAGVQCAICGTHFDFSCASIIESGWKRLGAERRSAWKCSSCKAASPIPTPIQEQVTLESVMKEILDVKLQLVGLPKVIEDIKCIREEIVELKASCQFSSDKIDEFTARLAGAEQIVDDLEAKYIALESSQNDVKLQISSSDHRSRLNNIESKGRKGSKEG